MADTSYILCGFASGVDWRPVTFKEPLPPTRVCNLCGFVPSRMAFLPCGHVFCSDCVERCAGDDGRHVCPLDRTPFQQNVYGFWLPDPRNHLAHLQVGCWNSEHGCDFMGPLGELLEHFEQRCGFHTASCPRCRDTILRNDVPRHCNARCAAVASPTQEAQEAQEPEAPLTPTAPLLDSSVGSHFDVLESMQCRVDELSELLSNLSEGFAEWDAIWASLRQKMSAVYETCDELRRMETRLVLRRNSSDVLLRVSLNTRRSSI